MDNIILLISDSYGIYIPQYWADDCAELWTGYSREDLDTIKSGPDSEWYWEAWAAILDSAECVRDGKTYTLHQDGDLWAIAYDDLTDSEYRDFFGEDRS